MTQDRTHTLGLGNPPLIQLLLDAVLCAFVSLAQGVATTLGMRLNFRSRDWHTATTEQALPQAKPDIQIKDTPTPTESFSASCRESLLDPKRERADDPREIINQDPRDKPEDDSSVAATLSDAREAFMVSSTRSVRPSNHDGGLTTLSPLIPANAGIHGGSQGVSWLAAAAPRTRHNRSWMATFVGSGELSA